MAGRDGAGGGGSKGSGRDPGERPAQRGVRTTLAMAQERLSRGDARSAEALCREAHGEHGADAELLALLGRALTEQGRYGDAAPFLAQSISLDRRNARAHRDLGEALLHGGRSEVALVMLQRARRLAGSPLPGLDALITRARDATEREGLTVIAAPDDVDGERTVILRLTDPGLQALQTDPGGADDEADETMVLDQPPIFSDEESLDSSLTDPAAMSLPARGRRAPDLPFPLEERPDSSEPAHGEPTLLFDDGIHREETQARPGVLYLGPTTGAPPPPDPGRPLAPIPPRPRPPVTAAPPPVLSPEVEGKAGKVLAGLAAAMPQARSEGNQDRIDIGVEDVLNAVLGGNFLSGQAPSRTGTRGGVSSRRLWRSAGIGLGVGLAVAIVVRLIPAVSGSSSADPDRGSLGARLASDDPEELERMIEELAPAESDDERLARAHALALRLAHHGGEAEDARTALDLLAILPPELGTSPLGLSTLAELRVAADRLPEQLRARLTGIEPSHEALPDALSFVASDAEGLQPPRARALAHRSVARLALARGDLRTAVRQLEATLALAPDDPGTHRTLLRLAGRAGALLEVETELAALQGSSTTDLLTRTDAHLWKLVRGEGPDLAERTELQTSLATTRNPVLIARTELVLAITALQGRDLTGTERHLAAASDHPRGRILAELFQALSQGEVGEPDPERASLRLRQGELLPTPGEPWPFRLVSEALGPVPDAAGASPEEVAAFLARAHTRSRILVFLRDPKEKAAPAAKREASATDPDARLLSAHLLLHRRDPDAALAELPQPSKLSGGESGSGALAVQLLRGVALHQSGQTEAAEGALKTLSDSGTLALPALELLGRLRLAKGEPALALSSLDTALALDTSRHDLELLRVIALHRLGRPDEATRAMTHLRSHKEVDLPPLLPKAPKERAVAELYQALSEPEPATEEMETLLRGALKGDARLFDAHFHLGRLLARLDRKRPARKELGRYLKGAPEGLYAETARALLEELR